MTNIPWTVEIPKEPIGNIVLIKNISRETQAFTIKDFFSFCGIIQAIEVKMDDDEQHQVALVYFEKESAAKTATLLSQAVVDDGPIVVEPFYKGEAAATTSTIPKAQQQQQQQGIENKSVSQVMTELLASGYILTENVVQKGIEFDKQHGVSTRVNGYLNKVGINLTNINQRLTSRATATMEKSVSSEETVAPPSRIQNLLNSKAGLKVQDIASIVADKVSNVHEEAKRIALQYMNQMIF